MLTEERKKLIERLRGFTTRSCVTERALRKREKQKTLVEEMKRTGVVVTKVKR